MANTIRHKRSSTASAIPSSGSLSAGELAVNTADGKLFLKKDNSSIVEIGGAAAAGTLTGITLASNVVTSSLTQVGTLEFLNVTNTIGGSISGNAATATSASNALTANTATTATSALTAATVTTAAQPTITSVGTLTGLTVSGQINSTSITNTSSTTTGAIKTAGGIGVAKSVYIGQALEAVGNATFGGDFYIAGQFQSGDATASINSSSGAIITAGGVGIMGDMFIDGKIDLGTGAILAAPSATALAIKSTVPAGTGVFPTVQVICPSAAFALQNIATTQAVFNTPVDTISLQAATTYMFEGQYLLQTGTTSHTTTISFVSSGAITSPDIAYTTIASPHSSANSTSRVQDSNFFIAISGGIVATAAALPNTIILFKGIIRAIDAGTLVPNILFSVAPGAAANFTLLGSYIKFYPIGSNTIDSVGTAIS